MDKLYRILHIPSATLVCYSKFNDAVFVLKEDERWYNKTTYHDFYITKKRFNEIINSESFCVCAHNTYYTPITYLGLKDEFELID